MTDLLTCATNPVAPGRACDGCTLCCKVLSIEELRKPKGIWCEHCSVGVECRIYDRRPRECSSFYCGFLQLGFLSEEWRPSKSKIVLVAELDGKRIAAHVDPGRPDAWKSEPYYSQLKEWAVKAVPDMHQVVVCIGSRAIVILPDRDVDLGVIADDELIVTAEIQTPTGLRLEALKINRADPRATNLATGRSQATP